MLELAALGPDERNWRGIGIALLVIFSVCALIVTAVVLLTPGDKGDHTGQSRITLDEVVENAFGYKSFNGTWISGHEFVYLSSYGAVQIYDILNNSIQAIMPNSTFKQLSVHRFSLSPDRKYILICTDYERIFRYTYKGAFHLYNISSDHLSDLFPDEPGLKLQYAGWGPTGNQLAYVLENNVYYMSSADAKPHQLTTDGVEGIIYNGIPDWVYEEEILASSHALWWSEDGKKLCFASFNDSEVEEIMYPYYGAYKDAKNVYPEIINIRYPKAGRTNPTITLWVADLISNRKPNKVNPPSDYKNTEYYFTQTQWMDNNSLAIIWLKRSQNTSIISTCSESNNWNCEKSLQVDAYGHGWVDLYSELVFTPNRDYYFVILPGRVEKNAGRFRHIAMVEVKSGAVDFLTSGKYDVTKIISYDPQNKTVYYISTLEGKASERHLFGVTDKTAVQPSVNVCITCNISSQCLYNSAEFSTDASHYVLECFGPGIPWSEIRVTASQKSVFVLQTNEELKKLISEKAIPKVKKLQLPLPGNYIANVKLLFPPTLREEEITKYPMLVEVYAGPGSQMVKDSFNIGWGAYLASKNNIIYAVIDGRGSGFQGNKLLHELYKRLGTVEVEDQITTTKHLKEILPYIDEKKVAIFGWSYGGYVSAMTLASDQDNVFSCGISVAPVTSWLYYDSVYTERYMQMPTVNDNLQNYESSEVMNKAANFKGKRYLLVHGTADDNVHWQQSMMLAKALAEAGIIYRMQVYPDERHALSSVKKHLYLTIDDFLDQCFSETDVTSSESNDT